MPAYQLIQEKLCGPIFTASAHNYLQLLSITSDYIQLNLINYIQYNYIETKFIYFGHWRGSNPVLTKYDNLTLTIKLWETLL